MRKLRRIRAEKGLTMDALEERTGVSKRTISEIERGMRAPQALTLARLAGALDVDIDDLQEDEAPKAPAPPPLDIEEPADRGIRYLRGWRAFVWQLEHRWEREPPQTSRETAPLLDVMTALIDQGVFEITGATDSPEWMEIKFFVNGVAQLNKIADAVKGDEAAEERRAAFTVIQNQMSA